MASKQPALQLSSFLRQISKAAPSSKEKRSKKVLNDLQLQMLRVQQGVWHQKKRVIILLEGFDAAGKGGAIRRITEGLDPRGVRVIPIGPPSADDQARHYLYRFWRELPNEGCMTIFDRSWYGRVLVEKVEGLVASDRAKEAYNEINEFEKMLLADGVELIKIFLAISKDEQLKRFQQRLEDPYKQWKLTPADIEARRHWDSYVEAVDAMLAKTSHSRSPWFLVNADDKQAAREQVLQLITKKLRHHALWMESKVQRDHQRHLKQALQQLESIDGE